MQSALIVHSKHTRYYALSLAKEYEDVVFLEVTRPPTKETLKIDNNKDIVIGVGGGSVIDTAKIISRDKRCVAVPTTASGAAMTPYATVWGEEKMSVVTKKPLLRMDDAMAKNLPPAIRQSTAFDALSHAIESLWSKDATPESRKCSKEAIRLLSKYFDNSDINTLINAGNLAGRAIAITKTNVVHAASYPLTTEYGIDHGTACGMLLPCFIEYMDFKELPELFNFDSTNRLVSFLKKIFVPPEIENLDAGLIAGLAIKYERIDRGPKKISQENLKRIISNLV